MEAMAQIDVGSLDMLIIENVGNLICPVGFDLGQDVKVGMFCTAGGDDKAAKHPYIVKECSLLLLNKTDLLPHLPFNLQLFRDDISRLNSTVQLLELSAFTGAGWIRGLPGWNNCGRTIKAIRGQDQRPRGPNPSGTSTGE